MSLRDSAKKLNNGGIPFMEGRTKGELEEILGKIVTLNNYGFIKGDDGEYVVFTVKEIKDTFYFGGMVLTDNMKKLDDEGNREEIERDGLPLRLSQRKSKKTKKTYFACEFYPEDEETADDLPC